MQEQLNKFVNKVVVLYTDQGCAFGPLQANGDVFVVKGNSFKAENVKEVTEIEASEQVNAARAGIKV